MGVWLWITLLFILMALAVRAKDALLIRHKLLGTATIIVLAYLAVTISENKTVFLGAMVTTLFLGVFLISTRTLAFATEGSRARRMALSTLLVLLAMLTFTWHWKAWSGKAAVESPVISERRHELVKSVALAIARASSPDKSSDVLYLPAESGYLVTDQLRFQMTLMRRSGPEIVSMALSSKLDKHLSAIARANLLLLVDPSDSDVAYWLPSKPLLSEIQRIVRSDPTAELIDEFPTADGKGKFSLYKRNGPLKK
jgi:hypothetical protein